MNEVMTAVGLLIGVVYTAANTVLLFQRTWISNSNIAMMAIGWVMFIIGSIQTAGQ